MKYNVMRKVELSRDKAPNKIRCEFLNEYLITLIQVMLSITDERKTVIGSGSRLLSCLI